VQVIDLGVEDLADDRVREERWMVSNSGFHRSTKLTSVFTRAARTAA